MTGVRDHPAPAVGVQRDRQLGERPRAQVAVLQLHAGHRCPAPCLDEQGREVTLGELQALGLTAGINALIVGNYLTTLGRQPQQDIEMLRDLRMPIGALSKVI